VPHKKTAAPEAITKEQLLAIISTIEFACTILQALIPIIKQIIGAFEAQQKLIAKK